MPVSVTKENMLCNYRNKGEADELIIEIAVNDGSSFTKVVVEEDIDILVILFARAEPNQEI